MSMLKTREMERWRDGEMEKERERYIYISVRLYEQLCSRNTETCRGVHNSKGG